VSISPFFPHSYPSLPYLCARFSPPPQASRPQAVADLALDSEAPRAGAALSRAVMQRISSAWGALSARDRALWGARVKAQGTQYKAAMEELERERPDLWALVLESRRKTEEAKQDKKAKTAAAKAAKAAGLPAPKGGRKARAAAVDDDDSDGDVDANNVIAANTKRRRVPTTAARGAAASGADGPGASSAAVPIDDYVDPSLPYFDRLLKEQKIARQVAARARGVGESKDTVQEGVRAFLEKMAKAADEDLTAVKQGKPAVSKLRDVAAVAAQISNQVRAELDISVFYLSLNNRKFPCIYLFFNSSFFLLTTCYMRAILALS